MEKQRSLFDIPRQKEKKGEKTLEKFQGALAFSAIGDALGWPTEFGRYPKDVRKRFGKNYLSDFVEWEKLVGGRYWGYKEKIKEGEYSDDTQLSLSVARCIDENGDFKPDKFAYLELPPWLSYERGGGRSIKTAARSIIHTKRGWTDNFYIRRDVSYRNAGANGAAMRTLPIALVNKDNEERLYKDSFLNAIITHGHPRAIVGTIIYASAVRFLLKETNFQDKSFYEYIRDVVENSSKFLKELEVIPDWISEWDKKPLQGLKFNEAFRKTREESRQYLEGISKKKNSKNIEYYKFVGALDPRFRGSGLSTVFVALYLFVKYLDVPQKAVLTAVNMLGSDTDTIANFIGGLFGAYYGLSVVPKKWLDGLKDKNYILKTAQNIYDIITGRLLTRYAPGLKGQIDRYDALSRVMAWEIGLHEMFWDALGEGECVVHPALGRGIIKSKRKETILREDYEVKLIEVQFDCGQTCTFHHRVARNGKLSESLSSEINRILISERETQKLEADIKEMENYYTFINHKDVITFLEANRSIVKILKDANGEIKRVFGKDIHLYLELHRDPEEDFEGLFIVMKTNLSPEDSLNLLDRLDEEWWLHVDDNISNILEIMVRPT